MTRRLEIASFLFVLLALIPLMAQNAAPGKQQHGPKPTAAQKDDDSTRGEQVFHRNCARCHDAPQGFPPQISGTILRHMRVRASLNADDEKALLKFLNP